MKYSNLFFCIIFAILSLTAIVYSIFSKRIELACQGCIFAGISYVSYKDFIDPR